eukprot:gene916-236_t
MHSKPITSSVPENFFANISQVAKRVKGQKSQRKLVTRSMGNKALPHSDIVNMKGASLPGTVPNETSEKKVKASSAGTSTSPGALLLAENKKKRVLRRPITALPYSQFLYVKDGEPVPMDDMNKIENSVFPENRNIIQKCLEDISEKVAGRAKGAPPKCTYWKKQDESGPEQFRPEATRGVKDLRPVANNSGAAAREAMRKYAGEHPEKNNKEVPLIEGPTVHSEENVSSKKSELDERTRSFLEVGPGRKSLRKKTNIAPANVVQGLLESTSSDSSNPISSSLQEENSLPKNFGSSLLRAAVCYIETARAEGSWPVLEHFGTDATDCGRWQPTGGKVDNSFLKDACFKVVGATPSRERNKPFREAAQECCGGRVSKFGSPVCQLELKQRAVAYDQTGADPDLLNSLHDALHAYPGIERAQLREEMLACTKTFTEMIEDGSASVYNFNQLIAARGLRGELEACMELHDQMSTHNFPPNEDTYVQLITAAARAKDAKLAREMFLLMRDRLITPNRRTYTSLAKAHVAANDVTSAFALMRKADDEHITPDVAMYTVCIDGLVKTNRLKKAWEVFHSMRTWKLLKPDEVLFTVMIKACGKAKESERAINMLEDMQMCGLYPTDLTYAEMIMAMAGRADYAKKAFDYLRQMEAEEMPLTGQVCEGLLLACKTLGDIPRAVTVVHKMINVGIPMNQKMYHHCLGSFGSAMRLEKVTDFERLKHLWHAWQIVSDMRVKGVPIDTRTLNVIIKIYAKGGFSQHAVDMLQTFPDFKAKPDIQTYGALLSMFGPRDLNDPGRFFALWDFIGDQRKGLRPTVYQHHMALDAALESRSASRTISVLEGMKDRRIFPTPRHAETLAKVGRKITEIHRLVAEFIDLNREKTLERVKKECGAVQIEMDEQALRLAPEGMRPGDPTVEQKVRRQYFQRLKDQGVFKKRNLPKQEYLATTRKGGELYKQRHDKKKPQLLEV